MAAIPSAKMTEAQWQKLVIDLAHLYGYSCAHFRPARVVVRGRETYRTPVAADGAGFVDLVLVHPDRGILFAELKSETGKLTPDQERWRDCILAAGGRWCLWRPGDLDEVARVLGGG